MALSAKQHSVFSLAQAVEAGMTARTVQRRAETGRWRRLYRSVYTTAGREPSWEQLVAGACLACGPRAVASHDSAEVVWAFTDSLVIPSVTVLGRSTPRLPGIEVHRTSRLDAVGHNGFRVTHPMRTLLDLAPVRREAIIERYIDDAHRRGLIAVRRFQQYLAEPDIRHRAGAKLLRELLSYRDPDAAIDSVLETDFFVALRRAGLPLPVPQHPVITREGEKFIDFAYPDLNLAIELDGYADRANRVAFERDRARQNVLEELGWSFRRFTWTQVRTHAAGVACTVGLALGLRPVRWSR